MIGLTTSPNYSIAGIDWVTKEVRRTGTPSVASISLTSAAGGSMAMDQAVEGVCWPDGTWQRNC